jgi:hypothetical protein
MPKRLRSIRGISAEQAHQALSVLVHEGKTKATEVWAALKRRELLLNDLKARLAALGEGMKGAAAKAAPLTKRTRKVRVTRKRRKPISAARRAAMKAQGRYLAAVRPLSKAHRAKVRAIRQKVGVTKAIAAAKRMAK